MTSLHTHTHTHTHTHGQIHVTVSTRFYACVHTILIEPTLLTLNEQQQNHPRRWSGTVTRKNGYRCRCSCPMFPEIENVTGTEAASKQKKNVARDEIVMLRLPTCFIPRGHLYNVRIHVLYHEDT